MHAQNRIQALSRSTARFYRVRNWNKEAPTIGIYPSSWCVDRKDSPPIFYVCSSIHSSYSEIETALSVLRPREVVPTANLTSAAADKLQLAMANLPTEDDSPPDVRIDMHACMCAARNECGLNFAAYHAAPRATDQRLCICERMCTCRQAHVQLCLRCPQFCGIPFKELQHGAGVN